MKIGIVGNGFVGNAVRNGFSPNVGCDAEVKVYDKNPSKSTDRLIDVVNDSDFVFVSVPTPSFESGESVIDNLRAILDPQFNVGIGTLDVDVDPRGFINNNPNIGFNLSVPLN